jgi:hypothetical protein
MSADRPDTGNCYAWLQELANSRPKALPYLARRGYVALCPDAFYFGSQRLDH